MRQFIRDMFSEKGDISAMRVMSMIALLAGIGLAYQGKDSCVMIFITAAFTGKLAQKAVETKS